MVIENAREAYQAQQNRAVGLGARVLNMIAEHGQRQGKVPRDWGYVGDLQLVNTHLEEVLRILGDKDFQKR